MNPKKILLFLAVTGIIVAGGLLVLWQFLPGILETRILPQLARQNNVGLQSIQIRHIGLTGFDAGPIIIGRDSENGVNVDAVQVDYTPFGLLQKRLNSITVSGLTLSMAVQDDGVTIAGIDLAESATASETPSALSKNASTQASAGSALAVQMIRVNGAVLKLVVQDEKWRIPFELIARLDRAGTIDTLLTLRPCGQKISLSARWDQAAAHGEVSLTAASLSLEKLTAMVKALPSELMVSGDIDLQAGAVIRLNPWRLEDMVLNVGSASFKAEYGDIGLETPSNGGDTDTAFFLNLRQMEDSRFALRGGNLALQAAIPVVVDNFNGAIVPGPEATDVSVQVTTRLPALLEAGTRPVALVEDVRLVTSITGRYALKGDWNMDIGKKTAESNGGSDSIALILGDTRVAAALPRYEVHMQGKGLGADGRYTLTTGRIRVNNPAGSVHMRRASLQGSFEVDASGESLFPNGTASLVVSSVEAATASPGSTATVKATIPEIRAQANMQGRPGRSPVFKGYLNLAESSLAVPADQVRLTGIIARLPWQWPAKQGGTEGRLSIARMRWKHLDVGSMGMTVRQYADSVVFKGQHASAQLPELELDFSGRVDFPKADGIAARVEATISRPATAPEIDLGKFTDGGNGVSVKGAISADLNASYTAGRMHGNACGRVDQTTISVPEKDLLFENLSLGICLPNLPQLTTSPSQTLTFDAASMGNFKIEHGFFHFQLEPYKTLFIEKGRIGWSGGKIRLHPMRITPGIDAYETRLECDRLNLAQILEQLAIADAKGDGTVNGTIPISIKKGRIRFDDGFLYSTPGDGGKISMSGADALMAGIPRGTRQFFQVDLAREALKDFDYKWAKLRLVSEQEELHMRLQFDGKPGRILPFEYSEEFGGFIRVDADSRGSEFEGISLDVNFRAPLNDLLEYKDLMELLE